MAGENLTPIPGKISRLFVAVKPEGETPPEWKRVGGRVDMNLNVGRGEIDASHMDSGGWSDFLMGRRNWTISGNVRYLKGDPGQDIITDHVYEDEATEGNLLVRFALREATGADEWTGEIFATSNDLSSADESPSDMSLTLRGTGPLSKVSQTAG